jgi:D-ornithine 4,5-aminomutase subunit alpha
MKGYLKRDDDFQTRRSHLKNMNDEDLKKHFWSLTEKIVDPLLEMAKTHTSPSIERSVLLRMGFSSIEVKPIVDGVIDRGLMGKGAGHVVYKASKLNDISIREAGLGLIDGKYWDQVLKSFKGGA